MGIAVRICCYDESVYKTHIFCICQAVPNVITDICAVDLNAFRRNISLILSKITCMYQCESWYE